MTDTGEHTVHETFGWTAPPDADPFHHWVEGTAVMGNTPFRMPIITPVIPGLWQGGYVPGLDLGQNFEWVLSLYPWQRYPIGPYVERREVEMYDSDSGPDDAQVRELATWVNEARRQGPTLVHCQAGLNRSALIVAAALVLDGHTPDDAIALLRERRSPAVLCNPTFERFIRGFTP